MPHIILFQKIENVVEYVPLIQYMKDLCYLTECIIKYKVVKWILATFVIPGASAIAISACSGFSCTGIVPLIPTDLV